MLRISISRNLLQCCTLFLCSLPLLAHAAPTNTVYQEARDTAQLFVNIKVKQTVIPPKDSGECTINGVIHKIYRNRTGPSITLGQKISFSIPCKKSKLAPPKDFQVWQDMDKLQTAVYLDVYLNPVEEGKLEVALYQAQIVDQPKRSKQQVMVQPMPTSKPASQPSSRPTPKPAPQPSSRPAPKPAPQPSSKPASKSTSKLTPQKANTKPASKPSQP